MSTTLESCCEAKNFSNEWATDKTVDRLIEYLRSFARKTMSAIAIFRGKNTHQMW
ncbi:hypothetical protein [Coleofasciculus sp. H7-2]|uniref:hypothetical protein n=1 Tax=Coleofasciculus sp. H7-2 TaxID=3351545 RepID=UPI00366F112D